MLTLDGSSRISFFKFWRISVSFFSKVSAKWIASSESTVIWEVYALVDATAISGPAWVYIV